MSNLRLNPFLVGSLSGILLVGVSCTTILRAHFESDAVGSPPNTSLPGNPTGDVLQVEPPLLTTIQVIGDTIGGTKALQFSNPDLTAIGGHQRWIRFKAKEVNLNKPITWSWTGRVVPSGNSIMMGLGLTGSSSTGGNVSVLRLTIENSGELSVRPNNYTPAYGPSTPVGNVGYKDHSIIVTLNTSTRKFHVSLFTTVGESRSPLTASGDILVPIGDINLRSNRPSVSLGFDGSGTPSPRKYLIDDLVISRGND